VGKYGEDMNGLYSIMDKDGADDEVWMRTKWI
jgi:hypothetical protein